MHRPLLASLLATSALVVLAPASTAHAACVVEGTMMSGNNPASGQTIVCSDGLDNDGVNGPAATGVTVRTESPSGGISVTGQPGVLLGADATIEVGSEAGSAFPINTSGDSAAGIDVLDGATITVDGQVATSGEASPAIRTGDAASVTVNGAAVGRVQTGGGSSPAISVGALSSVETTGAAVVTTGNSNSDAIVLRGDSSSITVGTDGRVSTSSGMSNPIQVDGAMGTVDVSGRVQSSAGDATAILGTADMLEVTIRDGGFVTAQSSGSNGIESQGSGASITVENGGEVRISAGNSAAIVAGSDATVNVDGTVGISSSDSQGIVLGDGSELTVQSRGIVETSSSESQAVLVSAEAGTATVQVDRGGNIDAVGAQAVVDEGETETEVTVDGTVFGGSSEPVLDMGAGDDTVIVNGTVRATSADPVIDLGAGDDRLENNSSTTIEGPGTLASGGDGEDTLVLANGTENDSSRYDGFETTTAQRNSNPNDPANGQETTLNVTDQQAGRQSTMAGEGGTVNVRSGGDAGTVSAMSGGSVNVESGGAAGVAPDGQAGANQGGAVNFAQGATARTNATGSGSAPEAQTFTGVTFDPGTQVDVANRSFTSGTASATPGQLDLTTDFAGSETGGASASSRGLAEALDAALASGGLTPEQQAALDTIASTDAAGGAAALFELGGLATVQGAAAGFDAALRFNSVLRPVTGLGGTRAFGLGSDATTVEALSRGIETTSNADLADVVAAPALPAGRGAWIGVYGGWLDVDANGLSSGFDADTYGVALGYEQAFGSGVAGVALGYSGTDVDTIGTGADIDTYSIGAYLSGTSGPIFGRASVAYSYQDIDAGAASLDGHVLSATGEGVYNLTGRDDLVFGPIGRLEANFADYDGFAGAGPLLGAFGGADVSQFVAGIGLRLGTNVDVGGALVSLEVDALYEGVTGDESIAVGNVLAGTAFTSAAPFADDDRLRLGVGAGVAISDSASLDLRYDGTFGDDVTSHGASAKVTFRF